MRPILFFIFFLSIPFSGIGQEDEWEKDRSGWGTSITSHFNIYELFFQPGASYEFGRHRITAGPILGPGYRGLVNRNADWVLGSGFEFRGGGLSYRLRFVEFHPRHILNGGVHFLYYQDEYRAEKGESDPRGSLYAEDVHGEQSGFVSAFHMAYEFRLTTRASLEFGVQVPRLRYHTYEWEFGDGTTETGQNSGMDNLFHLDLRYRF